LIERFFNKSVDEIMEMPISVYNIYSEQAINNLAASMGNKFETEIGGNKKQRLRNKLKQLKQEAEFREQLNGRQ